MMRSCFCSAVNETPSIICKYICMEIGLRTPTRRRRYDISISCMMRGLRDILHQTTGWVSEFSGLGASSLSSVLGSGYLGASVFVSSFFSTFVSFFSPSGLLSFLSFLDFFFSARKACFGAGSCSKKRLVFFKNSKTWGKFWMCLYHLNRLLYWYVHWWPYGASGCID
jgi:hypothetical protein